MLLGILQVAALAYLGLCALLFLMQRSMLYFPVPRDPAVPMLRLDAGGIAINVSIHEHAGTEAVIYFGGNAEDVSASVGELAAAFPGHAVYALHYRGYGGSEGTPGEAALHADAAALWKHVAARHARIAVVGRSLGSGVAVRLAAERDAARLVLITPYDSMVSVARAHYGWLPVGWLLRDRYDAVNHAPAVRAPTLLRVAGNDEVIPRASSERLFTAFAPGVARMEVVPGADHNGVPLESPRKR